MGKVSMAARQELIQRDIVRYRKAGKKEKGQILDNICASTGLSRDRAKRLLGGQSPKTPPKRRPGRGRKYDAAFAVVLEKIWVFMDFACGRRMVGGMEDMVHALTSCGELEICDDIASKLRTVSASTVDRLLSNVRKRLTLKGKSTTKPGTLLKRSILIRLGTEWDDAVPGFVEIDLVAHCGEAAVREYVNTLAVTDVSSGWTETQAVPTKAQRYVFQALQDIEARQPFPYKGIDSDNGSEFINDQLFRWCKERGICFTRSRPNRKNDNCHVEQKNWHLVRRNIGYDRYEGQQAVDAMNEYYALLRLHSNFFLPHTKLIGKMRVDSRIRKRYDTPKTPYRRLMESNDIPQETKAALQEIFTSLNPAALKRDMVKAMSRLEALRTVSHRK